MIARYREHRPPAELSPFVESAWSVEAAQPVADYLVLPDGCLDIVYSPELGLRAVGAMTTAQTVALGAGAWAVGVRFRPGMSGAFLRVAARELTDAISPLEGLWGGVARRLSERLGNGGAGQALAALAGALRPPEASRLPLQRAIAAVVAANGLLDLAAAARQANLGPRQFRRLCLEHTGLAPKQLCRVLRFRHALRRLGGGAAGWARLAAECGYYDQAHLIHEFREFSGRTPGEYAARLA